MLIREHYLLYLYFQAYCWSFTLMRYLLCQVCVIFSCCSRFY